MTFVLILCGRRDSLFLKLGRWKPFPSWKGFFFFVFLFLIFFLFLGYNCTKKIHFQNFELSLENKPTFKPKRTSLSSSSVPKTLAGFFVLGSALSTRTIHCHSWSGIGGVHRNSPLSYARLSNYIWSKLPTTHGLLTLLQASQLC